MNICVLIIWKLFLFFLNLYPITKNREMKKRKQATMLLMMGVNLIILILSSCGKNKDHVSNSDLFQSRDTLKPIVKYLDGSSKMMDIVTMDNYYIVLNEVEAHEAQLAVYDKKTLKYLYSFIEKGHGNNEVIALEMLQNPKGDTLEVIDQAKYKIIKYQIGRDKAKILGDLFLDIPNVGPLQEIYRLNDSVIVYNDLDETLNTVNTKNSKIISTYNVRDSLGLKEENKDVADFHFVFYDNKLCLGFRRINALTLGKVDDMGKIDIANMEDVKSKIDKSDDRIYYWFVDMNHDYILAQYMGYNPGFISRAANIKLFAPKYEMEIYSSNLKPYKHVIPKVDILRCKIAKNGRNIYSWNPMDDNSNILKFSY